MKITILILLAVGLHSCGANKTQQTNPNTFRGQTDTVSAAEPAVNTPGFPETSASAIYSYQVIPAENATFGYEIKQNDRILIRQTTIPGMQGNLGFPTKETAEKAAELVLTKLKNGEMPPTVSEAEMKQIGAIK